MGETSKEGGDYYTTSLRDLRMASVGYEIGRASRYMDRFGNPYDAASFPSMDDIRYSPWLDQGNLYIDDGAGEHDAYIRKVADKKDERYVKSANKEAINDGSVGLTAPRIYRFERKRATYYENNRLLAGGMTDTRAVVKVLDLGNIYAENRTDRARGNTKMNEIANEIRVGFFLSELTTAYSVVVTRHFMELLDWFVIDENLYPQKKGIGPYQYIVSEMLDVSLVKHLVTKHPDMLTLKCTLWGIMHALESAWATHRYLHYDLHYENIMLKDVTIESPLRNKNYMYTRVYSDKTYRLPSNGLHNTIVKILDYGRNRMQVPKNQAQTDGIFRHVAISMYVDPYTHKHDALIVYHAEKFGAGLPSNRTWDVRRLMWNLVGEFPVSYWEKLKKDSPDDYNNLVEQMELVFDMKRITDLMREHAIPNPFEPASLRVDTVLRSEIREIYLKEASGFLNAADTNTGRDERDAPNNEMVEKRDSDRRSYVSKKIWSKYKTMYKEGTQQQFVDRIMAYYRWHSDVRYWLVWSPYETPYNASTFLSSEFFASFIVNDGDGVRGDDVWMGRRPSIKPLAMDETYIKPIKAEEGK